MLRGLNDAAQRKVMLESHKPSASHRAPQARQGNATIVSPHMAMSTPQRRGDAQSAPIVPHTSATHSDEAMVVEGVEGEIFTARADVNAVISELAPQLSACLPHASVAALDVSAPVIKSQGGGGRSQFVRPSSGAVMSTLSAKPRPQTLAHPGGARGAPQSAKRTTRKQESPPRSPPRPQPHIADGVAQGFRFLSATETSDVETEILQWRREAAEKQAHQHQSMFQWAMAELNAMDAYDSATVRDGPAPSVPSHFSVHALYTILQELLGTLCPWTELHTRLMGKIKQCLFLPRHELVQDFSHLGHSKVFLQTVSNMPLFDFGGKEEDAEDSWDNEASKRESSGVVTAQGSFVVPGAANDASIECDAIPHVDSSAPLPANDVKGAAEGDEGNIHIQFEKVAKQKEAEAAAAAADNAGVDASWSLVVQMQDARIGTLLHRLRMNNSAIVALRGLLKSVFSREDRSLQRVSFNGWRNVVRAGNHQQARLIRYFDHGALVSFKGMFFRRWARAVAVGRRQRLIRAKDEAVHSAKLMERRLREAVQVGREEVTRELEKVKATLSDERGTRERQLSSMLAEMEALGERIGTLHYYLKLTVTHKGLWRALWLTHHRENRLPQLLVGSLKDEATKFRDALRTFVGAGNAKGRSPVQAEESANGSEPATPQAAGGDGLRTGTPSTALGSSVAASQSTSARAALRLKLESVLIAWVNDVLVRLHVQRFLIAVRDDLSDGVIFAALSFALDRTRSPTERFMEESVRRLSPAALGRRLIGALKQASRRSASCFQGIPMLQLCPTIHDHFEEKSVLTLTSIEDPWFLWALSTLFVDYCMLQVFPEPLDASAPALPAAAATKKKASRSPSASDIAVSPATTTTGPPPPPPPTLKTGARLMCKDAGQFLVHQDLRSDMHVPELVLDAADYVLTSSMRPYTGHRVHGAGVPSVVIKRTSAGGRGAHAPSMFSGGGHPSLSTNSSDSGKPRSAAQNLQQKLRPVTAFQPTGPTSPTNGVSPSTSNLGAIRKKVPAPPNHSSSAGSNFGRSRQPHHSNSGRASGAVSPDMSQYGSGNDSPNSNSPTPTADPSHGAFTLDPSELAQVRSFGTSPVNTPDNNGVFAPSALESFLPLLRGKTEHSGVAQQLNDVLGITFDEDDDDDVDDAAGGNRESSVDSSVTRMGAEERRAMGIAGAGQFDEFDTIISTLTHTQQHQHVTSPITSVGATAVAGEVVVVHERRRGSVEFVGTPSRSNTPVVVPPLLQQPTSPVDDGVLMYDAVICGKMQVEAMQRKKAWADTARLVVTAVCTYGILERFAGQHLGPSSQLHGHSLAPVGGHSSIASAQAHPPGSKNGSALSTSAKSSSVLSRGGGAGGTSMLASVWDPKNASVSHIHTPSDGPLNAPLHL